MRRISKTWYIPTYPAFEKAMLLTTPFIIYTKAIYEVVNGKNHRLAESNAFDGTNDEEYDQRLDKAAKECWTALRDVDW